MDIKQRIERLEQAVNDPRQTPPEIILQTVKRDEKTGKLFALGERRMVAGSDEDFTDYEEYPEPVPLS